MELSSLAATITGLSLITLILNLVCGYFRARARKYSLQWFLYIHLSIPVIIAARLFSGLDYRSIPFFVLAAVAGQFFGGKLEL